MVNGESGSQEYDEEVVRPVSNKNAHAMTYLRVGTVYHIDVWRLVWRRALRLPLFHQPLTMLMQFDGSSLVKLMTTTVT